MPANLSLERSLEMLEVQSTARFMLFRGKQVPLCDYYGNCENKAYAEVYPSLLKEEQEGEELGWSYLCRTHFKQENKRFEGDLPYCEVD